MLRAFALAHIYLPASLSCSFVDTDSLNDTTWNCFHCAFSAGDARMPSGFRKATSVSVLPKCYPLDKDYQMYL